MLTQEWIELYSQNKTLKSFFIDNKIHSVAIYGGGIYGDLTYNEITKYGIEVKYCIDREASHFYDTKVIRPDNLSSLENIDLIIISISNDTEEIYKNIKWTGLEYIHMSDIIRLCHYKELILPYCEKLKITPYFIGCRRLQESENLTEDEKLIAMVNVAPEKLMQNLSYLQRFYENVPEFSDKYIQQVFTQSPLIKRDGVLMHSDVCSEYVNIIQGSRFTHNVPEEYDRCVHLIGNCLFLGYGVDDTRTVASHLQQQLNSISKEFGPVRVVNHGVWGINPKSPSYYYHKLKNTWVQPQDIVVFLLRFPRFSPYLNRFSAAMFNRNNMVYSDMFDTFRNCNDNKPIHFDYGHFTPHGMQLAAQHIFTLISKSDCLVKPKNSMDDKSHSQIPDIQRSKSDAYLTGMSKSISEYLSFLETYKVSSEQTVGAIVMNCNPFTKGHLYLIEYAASQVDTLYIFVVEEDRSAFSFQDRINMVKRGTQHLKNVIVLPSGRYILSTDTFPEYFIKDSAQNVTIDTTYDIRIFATIIAPALNIQTRFVGKEPFDPITRQYNQTMKDVLPQYQIKLVEIDRLNDDQAPISASRVRALLHENRWDELSLLVPHTTLEYLKGVYPE